MYELTGRTGETLWESIPDSVFDDYMYREARYYEESSVVRGDTRPMFVEWLSYTKPLEWWESVANGLPSAEWRKWAKENAFEGEDDLRHEWANEEVNELAANGWLWDHIDQKDDVDVALGMGLVGYDTGKRIPADVAAHVRALCAEAYVLERDGSPESRERACTLRAEAEALERETVAKMIRVTGFHCDIHGGVAKYPEPVPRSEVIVCPSCGHPICPVCANAYDRDPATEGEARKYLASCDECAPWAFCGNCGDGGESFMLRFLRLVGCPIPPEYEGQGGQDAVTIAGELRASAPIYATPTVASLPDAEAVVAAVREKLRQGGTGYVKVPHRTGEIWGIPERHPDGWVVTICYPHER